MTDLIIAIAITLFLTIPLEVYIDPILWKKKLNEKLISNSGRLLIIVVLALILKDDWLHFWKLVFMQMAVYSVFDQVLNVVRWENLPIARNRKITAWMKDDINVQYQTIDYDDLQKEIKRYYRHYRKNYIDCLSFKERMIYRIKFFLTRFFYHGDENTKSIWDRAFQRARWGGEILFKGILIYTSIVVYIYEDTIFDAAYYLVIGLF